MKNLIALLSFVILLSSCRNADNIYNVKKYGCTGNKSQIATSHIQKAIDECAGKGGGTILFPPGNYTTGQLELRSNITIILEAGATLYASRNFQDYKNLVTNYLPDDKLKKPNEACLLRADSVNKLTIKGMGTIDGMAEQTWEELKVVDDFIKWETENAKNSGVEMKRAYQKDPKITLLYFTNCKNVLIEDVTIKDSPNWTCNLNNCEIVNVHGIKLYSSLGKGVNADGIDVDGCRNVCISDCIIETGDDAICLKTPVIKGKYICCENVVVANCILTSTSTAIKLGTSGEGDFRNILFNNCVIRNSNRGLSIVVRDGANVSDVVFSNITIETNRKNFFWWGNGDAIWVVLLKRTPESRLGSIKNVVFQNIIAHSQGTSKIEGFKGKPLENIKLYNVQFYMGQESTLDKRATDVLFAHDVNGLQMNNCQAVWDTGKTEPKWNVPFHFKNVSSLQLNKLSGKQPFKKGCMILCEDVHDALITQCLPQSGTDAFLNLSGSNSEVLVQNNFLHHARIPYIFSNGANPMMISGK
jgi:hypothetical protein